MAFLPKGTEIPVSNYFKFTEEENRFRVLGSAIVGFELWVQGKPVRRKSLAEFTSEQLDNADINTYNKKKKTPQYFWAFPVYNYKEKKIGIQEVTQVTIMRGIEDYLKDEDYGKEPQKYDLIVIRDDTGERTKYRVKAKPPKEIDEGIAILFEDMHIDMNKLYSGGDPFSVSGDIDPEEVKV